ncbi:fibronectin type III domain-containing protein [Aquimarina sp. 2201CG5-10]|uniref:fibronectin type III domain-containing protein n=1 Tax=Aquimarina callyspongiae TaxID=3098150 RepID=UPI002AB37BF9|nr:fibronectin type III domain-containing protein [Aquimarina sp. 2201CG5-10]MDY8136639.1 fibronectin type III domain-containing protein [Aquimarina sp. 2201CG5-10]
MKSRKNIFLLIPLLLFSVFLNAQNSNDRENIKKQTNLQNLQKIIVRSNNLDIANIARATKQKISVTSITEDGRLGVLFGFDKNGTPIYAYDDNVNAAITGRTDKIWQGGSSGLNLSGNGIEIGVWESGYARPTHVEFGGRASNGGDGGSVTSHGTHTGGTLIASGVDSNARGMASGASIKNYTASGMVAETASFAAAGGILANNSNTPGGTAGEYNAVARDMDEVIYNAPFYLHCKSAGNSGNTYGVVKSTQVSKNLLVVGNSNDVLNYTGPGSVNMSSSSSYGPPDDWRIKPDITNNGTTVYSSDSASNTDYGTKSGTSMSTPATAGSIALLQQHYKNLNNVYMKAATAKALIIDTADEIGANDGPDFASGWGLVNAERAAQVISNNGTSSIIEELTLNNGSTYTKTITSDGSTPLALTIVWNDPAGTTGSGTNPVLVNDLDVRVTGNGNTYAPWVMVPNASFNNYTDPAQRGDNFRDNVEKIDAVLAAGTYTITITHKGTLSNGSQDFSLVANGVNTNVVPDNEAPGVPANLTASNIGSTTVDLSWNASTDNVGVTGYEIFQNGTSIGTATTTNFNVTGLTAETTYNFTVNAKDAAGNTSGNSNTVNITTTAPPACTGIASFPYNESFESGVGVWIQETNDDLNWVVDSAGTPSNNTGPSAASDGTNYIYTEATGNGTGFPNKVALLTSPCIDLTNQLNPELNFDYHMFGAAMGTLEMRASTDNGITWTTIWSLSGDQGNNWNTQTISLATYSGSVIKLQIKGTTGDNFTSDMTIDNLSIISSVPDNEAPSIPANLTASNIGSTTVDLSWTASTDNVGVTGYEIFQNGASIGTATSTNFNLTGFTPETAYSFTVNAKDAAGNTSGNSNTVNITTTAPPACAGIVSFPYNENFESGVGVWTQETNDDLNWIVDSAGTPSNNTGPSAASDGTNYIYTEATGNGTGFPNKVALLTSPCIDLINQPNPELKFDYHMFGAAMGTLEMRASTDDGITWITIWSLTGDQGNNWNTQTVSLAAYSGSVIKLQIKGTTGDNFTSDMTVDNLSIISSVPDNEAPSIPANLTASNIGSTTIDLSWTASTDNVGVTGYEIFQNGTSIGIPISTNYSVTGLTAETAYSFTVNAKDAAGNTSGNSSSLNVTTTTTPTQLFTVGITTVGTSTSTHADRRAMPYTMPENGTLQSIAIHVTGGSGDMQLGVYADNNGVPANKIGQTSITTINSTTGWQTIALENPVTISNGETIWLAWMLSTNPGVAYVTGSPGRYSAAGTTWSTSGNNMPSNYGTGSQSDFRYSIYANYTQFVDTQAPSVPTNFTASNIRNTSVDLSWNASTDNIGVTEYDIYQGTTIVGSSTTTSYNVTGLTANTSYSFTVRAKDAAGNVSANSSVINITTTNVVQYTLTTNTIGQGTVSGSGTYNSGEIASVTATPTSGWEFAGWSGDLTGNTNPESLTMNADKTVTATFTEVISVSTSTEKYRLTWRDDPSTTMVIGWNQVRGTNPVVHYGPTDFGLSYSSYPLSKAVDRTVSSKGMSNNYTRLTGLQSDTAYYFVIKDSEGVSKRYWFKTAPNDPTTRLSIIAGGDSRNNRTPRQNANRLVAKIRPHAVLFGGDMTSSSSSSQWQNWFNDWQLTVGSDGRMIPVVAARGNHESSNDIRDLFDIPTTAGGEYYALSFGGNLMRTYTLNTEVTPAGTQGTWLANDLTANAANHTWAIAQYHRSTRPHEPGKSEQNDQYDAWSIPFYTHAVQLVMESDSHVVKRTWPVKPSTAAGSDEGFIRVDNDPKRAVYVGEGCWGAPLRNASDTKNWTRAAGSFNQFKWLWIDQNKIELRTIKVDNATSVGQLSDSNLFTLPTNIDIWNPSGGNVVVIDNPHAITVRSIQTVNTADDANIHSFDLSVYPNPIESGLLHIAYPDYNENQKSKAVIKDILGKKISEVSFESANTTYNIDNLNAGVYFVIIKTKKGEVSSKFIKK